LIKSSAEKWEPSPGPQTEGYYSPADILGYGGSAGGGKTDLLLGLAKNEHTNSVIFRRVFPNLRAVIERSREVFNPTGRDHQKDTYNESLHRWALDGRILEFEACQYEKDKNNQRGRPRDFYGFDEVTEFSKSMVEFIMAWLRSTDPDQRCRVVMTFNPPSDDVGTWVVEYFRPWLAYLHPNNFTHPNPAKPGELRWYAVLDGEETECKDGKPFMYKGEKIQPLSRTFIPAKLDDNPYLRDTNYRSILQSMPEPLRSQLLHGDFSAAAGKDPWQVLPTEWVRLAQARWLEREKPDVPLTAVGVDAVRGGQDKLAICKRYDNWFDEVYGLPGVNVEDGPALAAIVWQELDGEKPSYVMNIDAASIGASGYDSLKTMYRNVIPLNASEGSDYRDKSKAFKMRNTRAEYYWRMREALDPEHGDDIALPPGNEIVADLCAARWSLTAAGIQIEKKEDIKDRIGRSPDKGEAILFANMPKPKGKVPGILAQGKVKVRLKK